MTQGFVSGRVPPGKTKVWAFMPFVGRFGLAHFWTRVEGHGENWVITSACGMVAAESSYAGLLKESRIGRCKNCERRAKP